LQISCGMSAKNYEYWLTYVRVKKISKDKVGSFLRCSVYCYLSLPVCCFVLMETLCERVRELMQSSTMCFTYFLLSDLHILQRYVSWRNMSLNAIAAMAMWLCLQCTVINDVNPVQTTLLRHNKDQPHASQSECVDIIQSLSRSQGYQTVSTISTHTLWGCQGWVR